MKKKILFVDEDSSLLAGLSRMLRRRRKQWDMKFVASSKSAIESISKQPFDAIVSELKMSGVDGVGLLEMAKKKIPNAARIILSGDIEESSLFRAIGPAHQCLSKPTNFRELETTINRVCRTQDQMSNSLIRRIVGEASDLASLPSHIDEILHAINDPEVGMEEVAQAISRDLGLTTKILRLVNSPFFGLVNDVLDPKHAVTLLGANQLRGIVLAASIMWQYSTLEFENFSAARLTKESLKVGGIAKRISSIESSSGEISDQAMVAGMLHNVGKLVLLDRIPQKYSDALSMAKKFRMPLWEAEEKVLGVTHAEVGAYLIGLWGLPTPVVEAIAFQHQPRKAGLNRFAPLVAVHVASAWTESKRQNELNPIDQEFLAQTVGPDDRMRIWQSEIGDLGTAV